MLVALEPLVDEPVRDAEEHLAVRGRVLALEVAGEKAARVDAVDVAWSVDNLGLGDQVGDIRVGVLGDVAVALVVELRGLSTEVLQGLLFRGRLIGCFLLLEGNALLGEGGRGFLRAEPGEGAAASAAAWRGS